MALVANHPVEVTMHQNALPGRQQSYFLESAKGAARTNIQTRNTFAPHSVLRVFLKSGEGRRYLLGPFLATIIGRGQDTGSLMEGVILIGAKDSVLPLHRHNNSHEAVYVLEGSAGLRLGDKEFALESGDDASVPPGTAHSFAFTSHQTRLLT